WSEPAVAAKPQVGRISRQPGQKAAAVLDSGAFAPANRRGELALGQADGGASAGVGRPGSAAAPARRRVAARVRAGAHAAAGGYRRVWQPTAVRDGVAPADRGRDRAAGGIGQGQACGRRRPTGAAGETTTALAARAANPAAAAGAAASSTQAGR